jgi:hypothetical protein
MDGYPEQPPGEEDQPESAIANYAGAAHNDPPEVRYVSSSDAAASGDQIT